MLSPNAAVDRAEDLVSKTSATSIQMASNQYTGLSKSVLDTLAEPVGNIMGEATGVALRSAFSSEKRCVRLRVNFVKLLQAEKHDVLDRLSDQIVPLTKAKEVVERKVVDFGEQKGGVIRDLTEQIAEPLGDAAEEATDSFSRALVTKAHGEDPDFEGRFKQFSMAQIPRIDDVTNKSIDIVSDKIGTAVETKITHCGEKIGGSSGASIIKTAKPIGDKTGQATNSCLTVTRDVSKTVSGSFVDNFSGSSFGQTRTQQNLVDDNLATETVACIRVANVMDI